MKKSDIIYEAACMVAAREEEFICYAIDKTRASLGTTFPIHRDIRKDIELLYTSWSDGLCITNNFYSASPIDWNLTDKEFQTIRAMYCLFLYEDYLSQGD